MARALACLALLLVLTGCSGEEGGPDAGDPPSAASTDPSDGSTPQQLDEELREELIQMGRQDQGLPSTATTSSDTERTARLQEIVAEHGWPTWDLVGQKAEDAAWVIAQHADLDPAFQAEALELLREAVAEGQASPGNLAYLEDRVRAGRGEPQLYGTQTGCTRGGKPAEPAIEDPAGLDERRAEADLPPYDRYLRQMTRVCAQG